MTSAFLFAKPPVRIASITAFLSAFAIASKLFLPNASSKFRFAAVEFRLEVFCDKIVPISDSRTLGTYPQVPAASFDDLVDLAVTEMSG